MLAPGTQMGYSEDNMNSGTFIFMGSQGSGKGTQVTLLQDYLKTVDGREQLQIVSGDMARNFMQGEGYSNQLARQLIEKGELLPLFLIIELWSSAFVNSLNEDKHLIVDGFPRTASEAVAFDSAMKFYQRLDPTVIFIRLSRELSKERMQKRGRQDDMTEAIENRLNTYEKETLPVVEFFRANNRYKFFEINGEQSIEAVFNDIKESLAI